MTKSELFSLMEEMGVSPKRSLGQNFLIGDHVVSKIINQVEILQKKKSFDWMIEIGPGLGSLTRYLRNSDLSFSLLELDQVFAAYWRTQEFNVLEGDALRVDWSSICDEGIGMLVSNLPYQISSSLVIERSITPFGIGAMVLMFQKEVAQKIMASCGASDYGFLSVIAQSFWNVEKVVDAARGDFYPPPNVASRVLLFSANAEPLGRRDVYLQFVKSAFAYRRKLVLKNWKPFLQKYRLSQEKLIENLCQLGYKETTRAQEITVEDYLIIFKNICMSRVWDL